MPNFRTQNINLSPIKEMELRAAKIPGVVSLAQGIPFLDSPMAVKRFAKEAIDQGKASRYSLTPGLIELREAIEQNLAQEGIKYDYQQEIIITAGSIEAISATLLALLEPGDEVILADPSYASYPEAIKVAGGVPIWASLNQADWSINIDNFAKAITDKTKAILIANPNNPTGTVYSKENQLELLQLAKNHDLVIITDEVYKDFVYPLNNTETGPPAGDRVSEPDFFTLASLPEARKHLVYIFSFSKSYAMTGWRVAYLAADHSLAQEILKVHDSLVTCAPVVSQYAAMAALEWGSEDVKKYFKIYQANRELICKKLDQLDHIFSYHKPAAGYLIFPKILIKHQDSQLFALEILARAKVAVVPGSAFGPSGEGHIRLCFGRSEDDITEAFERLNKYFPVKGRP